MTLIGKTCFYRPLYCAEIKNSKVSKEEQVQRLDGTRVSMLTLEDGTVTDGSCCYFSLSDMA